MALLSPRDLETGHYGNQEPSRANLLLVKSFGFIPNSPGSPINPQNVTENKVQRDQKRQGGTKKKKQREVFLKLCMYPYCSPHPARQPYPSHAQKYILERFKKKKKCNDDDDEDKPMKGMESCPRNLSGMRELSIHLSAYYFTT